MQGGLFEQRVFLQSEILKYIVDLRWQTLSKMFSVFLNIFHKVHLVYQYTLLLFYFVFIKSSKRLIIHIFFMTVANIVGCFVKHLFFNNSNSCFIILFVFFLANPFWHHPNLWKTTIFSIGLWNQNTTYYT